MHDLSNNKVPSVSNERDLPFGRERYVSAVVSGDEQAASAEVGKWLTGGASASLLYFELLTPCLAKVGEPWHEGAISIADEHHATQITLSHIENVRRTMARPGIKVGSALVTCAEGERHAIGARVAADMLIAAGWEVDFLGPDTPVRDLTRIVETGSPDLVCISVTMPANPKHARRAIAALKKLPKPPKVIVGGAGTANLTADERMLGGDAPCETARSSPEVAAQLAGKGPSSDTLETILSDAGRRVQARRKELKWSQEELATAAGLDRTYLSSIEGGKQNVTLAALKKLGDATGMPVDSFFERR